MRCHSLWHSGIVNHTSPYSDNVHSDQDPTVGRPVSFESSLGS